ncbi:MAG: DUF1572 family protein [Chitinophagaceae bacterium]
MTPETLKTLYNRELKKLKQEISLYQNEKKLWYIEKNIPNSGGNLCLHLVGNLNTYIGGELGKTGYIRNRDLEFSLKGISRAELLEKIEQTIIVVQNALDKMTAEKLQQEYPLLVFEKKTTIEFLLTSLLSHLSYHLGQINYHRRLLDA